MKAKGLTRVRSPAAATNTAALVCPNDGPGEIAGLAVFRPP
jgi:hypothetical protein